MPGMTLVDTKVLPKGKARPAGNVTQIPTMPWTLQLLDRVSGGSTAMDKSHGSNDWRRVESSKDWHCG